MQEIGPRFTLKLKWLKQGLPAVRNHGVPPPKPQIEDEADQEEPVLDETVIQQDVSKGVNVEEGEEKKSEDKGMQNVEQPPQKSIKKKIVPPTDDVYEWQWKVRCSILTRIIFSDLNSLNWRPRSELSSSSKLFCIRFS